MFPTTWVWIGTRVHWTALKYNLIKEDVSELFLYWLHQPATFVCVTWDWEFPMTSVCVLFDMDWEFPMTNVHVLIYTKINFRLLKCHRFYLSSSTSLLSNSRCYVHHSYYGKMLNPSLVCLLFASSCPLSSHSAPLWWRRHDLEWSGKYSTTTEDII